MDPLWQKRILFAVAAAALLLLIAYPLVRFFLPLSQNETPMLVQTQTIRIAADTAQTYSLPDQTKVQLSQGARLTYSSEYGKQQRAVALHGTARFDVTKNTDCPFTVQATPLLVEVTGTVFTVQADSTEVLEALAELYALDIHYQGDTCIVRAR